MKRDDDGREALYAVPPSGFVAARDRLAAELKRAGDAAGARAVKALKRPAPSVWAVNQLARRERAALQALLKLGERVRAHEARLLGGGEASGFLDEARQLRQDAARLGRSAEELLTEAGASANAAVRRRITQTLQAAAIGSDEARAALAAGRLEHDLAAPGELGAPGDDLGAALAASVAGARSHGRAGDGQQHVADERAGAGHGRKHAGSSRKHAADERRRAAAAERERAAAERERAAFERKRAASERQRRAAAGKRLASAERAVAAQRAAVTAARAAVETAESRLRAAKDALAAAEMAADAARRAVDGEE